MEKILPIENKPDLSVVLRQLLSLIFISMAGGLLLSVLGGVVAMMVTGIKASDLSGVDYNNASDKLVQALEIVQVLSVIGLFVLPAFLLPYFIFKEEPLRFLSLRKNSSLLIIILTIIAYTAFSPILEYSIQLNLKMKLPAFLKGVEDWMREAEASNGEAIQRMLKMHSLTDLLKVSILIALLPAIAEELFFRGLLQRALYNWTRRMHLSVFVSAVVFSAIHLQFYGFLPRLLLGIFLGYLVAWSGNIKLSMLAHFCNNFISVIISYLYQQHQITTSPDSPVNYPTVLYIISPLAGGFLLYLFYKQTRINTTEAEVAYHKGNWVKIHTADQRYQAEIIAGQLKAENIDAVVVNKKDSSYHFGVVEVFVSSNEAEKARMILGLNNN